MLFTFLINVDWWQCGTVKELHIYALFAILYDVSYLKSFNALISYMQIVNDDGFRLVKSKSSCLIFIKQECESTFVFKCRINYFPCYLVIKSYVKLIMMDKALGTIF